MELSSGRGLCVVRLRVVVFGEALAGEGGAAVVGAACARRGTGQGSGAEARFRTLDRVPGPKQGSGAENVVSRACVCVVR